MTTEAARTYVVGLPVAVTVAEDGTVSVHVDTSELTASMHEDDSNEYTREEVAADVAAVDRAFHAEAITFHDMWKSS